MRDLQSWLQDLRRQFQNVIPQPTSFIRTELMLYALHAYFPQQSIRQAHLLMQGYRERG